MQGQSGSQSRGHFCYCLVGLLLSICRDCLQGQDLQLPLRMEKSVSYIGHLSHQANLYHVGNQSHSSDHLVCFPGRDTSPSGRDTNPS